MRDFHFFYRSGINCLIGIDNRSNEWMCFVGVQPGHWLYGKLFYKTNYAPIHKYNNINNLTDNKTYKSCTWLGCAMHPYSEEKTMALLKKIADEVGPEDEEEDIFDAIFTMVRI